MFDPRGGWDLFTQERGEGYSYLLSAAVHMKMTCSHVYYLDANLSHQVE